MEIRNVQPADGSSDTVSLPIRKAREHHVAADEPLRLHADGSIVVRTDRNEDGDGGQTANSIP